MKNLFFKIQDKHDMLFKAFLFLLTLFVIVCFLPRQINFKYEYREGKPWVDETIIAPFDFPILKTNAELKQDKKDVLEDINPIFVYNEKISEDAKNRFKAGFDQKWKIKYGETTDSILRVKQLFFNKGMLVLDKLNSVGIIQLVDSITWQGENKNVLLKHGKIAEKRALNSFYTIQTAVEYIQTCKELNWQERNFLSPLILDVIAQNVYYDEMAYRMLLEQAVHDIATTRGMVQKGQIVIQQGELIDAEKFQILYSFQKEFENQHWSKSSVFYVLIGQILLMFIAFLILFLFLRQYRLEILQDTAKITMILLLVVSMIVLTSFVVKWDVRYFYLVPFCILPVVLKAFFDTRIALFVHIITTLIIGFIVPNGFEFVFVQIVAGIVSILTVIQMYKRVHLFASALKIIGIYFLTYFALEITHQGSISLISPDKFIYFAGSGVLTLLAYPLIFVLEKLFSLVSDISLLELSDTNNKLLRRLANQAPGTFHHSLQVANLAEEVIVEIGGNALLVRAGGLYHDIGKLKNPLYFIENQIRGNNPHDDLQFDESAEVIISHVKDGISLANEHRLPEELIDFIRTHHGTTTVQYFYKQFIANFPQEEVDIQQFTYPGPKPFSKETAVLMMADSVEAATRSIKQPDEEKINTLVENIIDKQIEQGQFTNANITLKEIYQSKKILKKKLINIHHARLEY